MELEAIDRILGERLSGAQIGDANALALAFLSAATRQGHLCVSLTESGLEPPLSSVFDPSLNTPQIESLVSGGLKQDSPYIVAKDRFYYFPKYFQAVQDFQRAAKTVQACPPKLPIDKTFIEKRLQMMLQEKLLTSEQALAIAHAIDHSLTLLLGGPGTGKTYTAGWLLKLFIEAANNVGQSIELALAAPTGKAARNLQKSVDAALEGVPVKLNVTALTLHKLLGWEKSTWIDADIVLVDESSMIDVKMMAKLFSSLLPGTRLILLGDSCQLPPVEAGSLFRDLSSLFPDSVMQLKKCLRAELAEIVALSDAVNKGDCDGVKAVMQHAEQGVCFVELNDRAEERFIKQAVSLFSRNVDTFRVLTPFRSGKWGVERLNQAIFKELFANRDEAPFQAPILLMESNAYLELSNGESGILVYNRQGEPDYALFKGVRYPGALLPRFEFAYCLSIHKSQGSEYEHVLCLLPEGSECFGRESLYTAVTRARRKIEIWSTDEILQKTLQKRNQRLSGLV